MNEPWHDIIAFLTGVGTTSLLVLFIFRVHQVPCQKKRKQNRLYRYLRIMPFAVWLLLAAYQARWQLFGFTSADFLRVQRGFDSRGDLLGDRFRRGAVFDARGSILARDIRDDSGTLERAYPSSADSVHLIGYDHPLYGSTGLERQLDGILMGRTLHTVSDLFRMLGNIFIHRNLRGNPVHLTMDLELQTFLARQLSGRAGAAVVIRPWDGSVLAMVSSPAFDPQKLTRAEFNRLASRTDAPFLNRATHGLYPPGSTIKPMVAAFALESGLSPVLTCTREGFDCGKSDRPVRDHEFYGSDADFSGHGRIDLPTALAVSCNVYFAQLAQQLTGLKILTRLHEIGFDRSIRAAGPGLVAGSGKMPSVKPLPAARTARIAIGQDDLLITPLQMALFSAAIGYQGLIYKPRYLVDSKPEIFGRLASAEAAGSVARMMTHAVENGTGRAARVAGVTVGGKTGTAELTAGTSHAWFVGFAPWPEPRIAFAIVIEHGGYGGVAAAPVAARLIEKASELGILNEPVRVSGEDPS